MQNISDLRARPINEKANLPKNTTMISTSADLLKQHQEAAKARLLEQQAKLKAQMDAKRTNDPQTIEALKAQQIEMIKKIVPRQQSFEQSKNNAERERDEIERRKMVEQEKKQNEMRKQRDLALKNAQELHRRQQEELAKKAATEAVKKQQQADIKKNTQVAAPFREQQQQQFNQQNVTLNQKATENKNYKEITAPLKKQQQLNQPNVKLNSRESENKVNKEPPIPLKKPQQIVQQNTDMKQKQSDNKIIKEPSVPLNKSQQVIQKNTILNQKKPDNTITKESPTSLNKLQRNDNLSSKLTENKNNKEVPVPLKKPQQVIQQNVNLKQKQNEINLNKEAGDKIKQEQINKEKDIQKQIQENIKKQHEIRMAQELKRQQELKLKEEIEAKKKIELEKAKKEAELRAKNEMLRQMELKKKEEEEKKQMELKKLRELERQRQWKQHQEVLKKEHQMAQLIDSSKKHEKLDKPMVVVPIPSSNTSKNDKTKIIEQPFKTTVTQQTIRPKSLDQTEQTKNNIKQPNHPSISVSNNLQTQGNASIIKKQINVEKNTEGTDVNKSTAPDNSLRSTIKSYPFSQSFYKMPPIQLPHGDENAHHAVKEDESWLSQHRVIPQYEVPVPKKMEIPEFQGSAVIKPTVIPPQVVESTKVKWNEFPEDPQYDIEHGQRVKTQEWVPVNDEEKLIPRTSYKPSKIGRTWPPPEAEKEFTQEGVLKVKTSEDTAWIQNQSELSENYPVWQQKTNNGSIKSKVWPPPEQDNLKSGYSGPNQMPAVQWPPPEFEEHEHEIVEVLQTHLPVNKHQRQWPPEPPKMVPAGTIQDN
uniref:Uncharacterized protein n=1 Tax=Parastrongyloides trichosuri TaxID=131310 RepID=A0A0N4ZS75_PARTI